MDYGLDINARDDCGRTAIFRAVARRELDGIAWLIKRGADLDAPDYFGARPIDITSYHVYQAEMVEILKEHVGRYELREIDVFRSIRGLRYNYEDY